MPGLPVTPITIKEAAERTGRTPYDIYQRTERGELAFAMLHGRRFVALEDMLALKVRRAA
jgi:hypothetical protein